MITDSQTELEKIFMSYDRVLYKLNLIGIKTKGGKEITHKDLRQAVTIMNKKHPTCRWKQRKYRFKKNKNYILVEGFYWLIYVYFQTEKNIVDADIDFFNMRIVLNINIWNYLNNIRWNLQKYT